MSAYKLMMNVIGHGRLSKEELTKKANVIYIAGQMSDEEYMEIMTKIEELA